MTGDSVSGLIRSAIRSDMETRIEAVASRLEAEVARPDAEDLVLALEAALSEVTAIVGAGLLARIRESPSVPS